MDKEEGKKMAKNLKKEAEEKLNKVEDKVRRHNWIGQG